MWIGGKNVHYPTEEPDPAHVEGSSQGKISAQRFGSKFLSPRTSHRLRKSSGPTLV